MAGRLAVIAGSVGLTLALAACGNTQGERGLSGAATGVLTTPSQVNVGKPAYKGGSSAGGTSRVRDIQAGLQRLGYDPGAADGRMGPKTSAAIRKYQQDNGMTVDGKASQAVLDSIRAKV